MIDVGILSVVPSPYQRDLFAALNAHPDVNPTVFYQSPDSVDNPWPEAHLHDFEFLLDGRRVSFGVKRAYVNWSLPDFTAFDVVILNTSYVSTAPQWLMRTSLTSTPWVFWGERMRRQSNPLKNAIQETLMAPLRDADAIACIGSLAVDAYRDSFPEQTLFNIPYYCDLSDFVKAREEAPPSSEDDVTFLFCGQMIHRKGVDLLVDAFDDLIADGVSARLLLVGREADLPDMLVSTSDETQSRVEFVGFQPPEALPALFARADVFVLPSRHDGWGVVVNEALGSGLPLICSDAVGAAHDIVQPETNGVRVPAGAVTPLRDQMRRLAIDPNLRAKWGRASARLVEEWTPEAGADRWARALTSVLSSPVSSASST